MVTFSQLPNEMIMWIWEYVLEPQDVESFALVSKHISAIGAPFVDEHNKLKKENASFRVGFLTTEDAPMLLLRKILLWPRVAFYVTHLSIGPLLTDWDDLNNNIDPELSSYHFAYPADDMELFVEAIRKADSVPRNEVEAWVTELKDGVEAPIVALLLLLLPNLCTMTLGIESDFWCQLTETFKRISETKDSPFLTRLTTVNLDVHKRFGDEVMDWELLSMSATLPSVQSIHVARIGLIDIERLIKQTRSFEPGSSTIEELSFIESSICPKSMFQLFESIKALKRFTYSNPDEDTQPFEPFWMGKALVAYAKHSLELLKITAEQTEGVGTLGSFRGCTKLRELETEIHLLVEKDRFHTLADLLPVSIEKVHLYTGDHSCFDSVLRVIEAFEKAKSQLLPNMRVLTLSLGPRVRLSQEDKELIKTSEKKCWDLGIELSVI